MAEIQIIPSGPLFRQGAAPVRDAIKDSIKDAISEGERKVKLQLYGGHGVDTGHYRRSVHGDVQSSLHGRVTDSKVIYGPWLETGKRRGVQTRFKGYAMFRNARQQIEKMLPKIVRKHIDAAVRKMNGSPF